MLGVRPNRATHHPENRHIALLHGPNIPIERPIVRNASHLSWAHTYVNGSTDESVRVPYSISHTSATSPISITRPWGSCPRTMSFRLTKLRRVPLPRTSVPYSLVLVRLAPFCRFPATFCGGRYIFLSSARDNVHV